MEHRTERIPAFDVIGLCIRTSNAEAMETIGPLWGRVHEGGLEGCKADASNDRIYAVYSNYESDHYGKYDYLVGHAVNTETRPPKGIAHVRVPEQRYAVVTAKGEMPGALIETWMKVWNSDIPRAFRTDFEIHDPANPSEIEIWLSVV